MSVGLSKVREVVGPPRGSANLLDDVLGGFAPAFRDKPQQGLPLGNEGGADGAKGCTLFRHPMQSVKGNHPVEFLSIGQLPDVGNFETEVGSGRRPKVVSGEVDHVLRWV